jgi:TRAP-type mannitol/chloroaromatic compound transport system permease small subunit
VRGDVVYRLWRPRAQAWVDLVLYFVFFIPAVLALIYSGWNFARMSVTFKEVSIFSPAGVPVFPLKSLIPLAGSLLLLQGLAEIGRCIVCIRQGAWPQRLADVEEIESAILHEREVQAEEAARAAAGDRR